MRLAALQAFFAWTVVTWALVERFVSPTALLGPVLGLALLGALGGRTFEAWEPRRVEPRLWLWALALPSAVLGLRALHGTPPDSARFPGWLPWLLLGLLLVLDVRALRRLARLVAIESMKLRRGLLFRAGLVATIAVTIGAGLALERLPAASGWSVAASSLGTGLWAAGIFVLVLGATTLSGESTAGTLKMLLPHAYRRSDWVLAKAAALLTAAVVFATAVAASSLLHAHLTAGLGDVTRELEPLFGEASGTTEVFAPAATMAAHFGATWLASLAALGTTGLLGLVLSSVFDSVVASLCVAFLLFAGLKFADVVFRVPQETLQGVYTWYPDRMIELLEKLGRAINERWDDGMLAAGSSLAVFVGAACLLIAIRLFSVRDV